MLLSTTDATKGFRVCVLISIFFGLGNIAILKGITTETFSVVIDLGLTDEPRGGLVVVPRPAPLPPQGAAVAAMDPLMAWLSGQLQDSLTARARLQTELQEMGRLSAIVLCDCDGERLKPRYCVLDSILHYAMQVPTKHHA